MTIIKRNGRFHIKFSDGSVSDISFKTHTGAHYARALITRNIPVTQENLNRVKAGEFGQV